MWEGDFVSNSNYATGFECSCHKNVVCLHFQSCVPGFSQYGIRVFVSPFSNVCPKPSGCVQLTFFFSFFFGILHICFGGKRPCWVYGNG